jgi:predicted dehydrogenase
MKKYHLGLIGAGEFGHFASQVITLIPQIKLTAVADTHEPAALSLAKKYQAKVFQDYRDLLKEKEVEIVFINTPNYLHAPMTLDALRYRKKVLCEKPLGISETELSKIKNALVKYQGALLVDFLLPHSQFYQKIKAIIASGRYGQLKKIEIKNLATEATIKTPWYWEREKSGGWFLTADIHFYDLLTFLTPQPLLSIKAKETIKNHRTTALSTTLFYQNFIATIFHSFTTPYESVDFTATLDFDKAKIIIKGWVPLRMIEIASGKTQEQILSENRETLYHRLVAENLKKLLHLNFAQSLSFFERFEKGTKIALLAQKSADTQKEILWPTKQK